MKQLLPLLILLLSITVSAQKKYLVPYGDIYTNYSHYDYVDSNIKLEYLVNADTNDDYVYLKITKGKLQRTMKLDNGIDDPPCYGTELAFYYDSLVYLTGPDCINVRGMTIVNLNNPKDDRWVTPLFIDTTNSILVYDTNDYSRQFFITKFNFKTQKEIQLPDIAPRGSVWDCFDDITYKDGVLTLEYFSQPDDKKVKKEIKFP
jgi:hypothetical protein